MRREEIKILIMRAPGTNCDAETYRSFKNLGVQVSVIHTQKIFKEKNLLDYDVIIFPGGFSYGDYVRSGAIWAKECEYKIGAELSKFVESGRPVIGICNGFQMLVEMGFLPGFQGKSKYPEAALGNNSYGYQCRWVRIRNVNKRICRLLERVPGNKIFRIPIAHGEGRFLFPKGKQDAYLEKLYENDQLAFRYVKADGSFPEGKPWDNPNGSFHDIAGICNREGNVLGLMPHPERAYFKWLMPDWTREKSVSEFGDGRYIFESIVKYVEKKN